MVMYFGIFALMFVNVLSAQTLPPNNLLAPKAYCGYQHADDYPRADDSISIDEFPWSVQLLYSDNRTIRCSGSLINRRYILTAAQCLNNNLTGVRLGDYNVTSDKDCIIDRIGTECSDPVQDFEIEETNMHPGYNPATAANDIALLRLKNDVMYSDYIRPICLPTSPVVELKEDAQLSTTGWGKVGEGLNQTEVKKKVDTTLVRLKDCFGLFLPESMEHSLLCAKGKHALTCQGDGGAPLMISRRTQWEQIGVLISKRACGARNPAVYIKVSEYIGWIVYSLRA
ncbi:serine protease 7-like isoform X2 [Photinus pyralis]|uniref:serine protease 7-like isoform X2 n=1 Tax=Photinus pyralis TaxID=7054 RepID=UPI0012677174|nr:serine protease 7-like isoform X2 [Photinus pyralis]XP_031354810.1 serine protease 7-like isoform X2 [Photinus pyralis]XP_031354811.1 serine protease 7-like isoform X2 [Photinus pyralis]